MTAAHWLIVAAVVVVAAGCVLWTWLRPRVRRAEDEELPSVAGLYPPPDDYGFEPVPFARWADQALGIVDQRQPAQESGMHEHMRDAAGYCQTCDAGPPSGLPEPNLDTIAEPDRRRAEHMNRTLRRITEEEA